ncbi:MAG: hypothetical protein ACI35W_01600 [Anaeroplasmataceae bacterium]
MFKKISCIVASLILFVCMGHISLASNNNYSGISEDSKISDDLTELGINYGNIIENFTYDEKMSSWNCVAIAEDYNSYEANKQISLWIYFYNPYYDALKGYNPVNYNSKYNINYRFNEAEESQNYIPYNDRYKRDGNVVAIRFPLKINDKYITEEQYLTRDYLVEQFTITDLSSSTIIDVYCDDINFVFETSFDVENGQTIKKVTTSYDSIIVVTDMEVQPVIISPLEWDICSDGLVNAYLELAAKDDNELYDQVKECLWFLNFDANYKMEKLNYIKIEYTEKYCKGKFSEVFYNSSNVISSSNETREIFPYTYHYTWGLIDEPIEAFCQPGNARFTDAEFTTYSIDKTAFQHDYSVLMAVSTCDDLHEVSGFKYMFGYNMYDDVRILRLGYEEAGIQYYAKAVSPSVTPNDPIELKISQVSEWELVKRFIAAILTFGCYIVGIVIILPPLIKGVGKNED